MTSEKSVLKEARLDALFNGQTGWINFGSFSNGWGPATLARYRRDLAGNVHVQFEVLSPGTAANGTTILSSANGLPAGFRIGNFTYFPVRQDVLAAQAPSVYVGSDGHMECFGVGSATRWDAYFTFYAEL